MTYQERTVRETSADDEVVQHTDEVLTTDPTLNDPVVTRTSETRVVEPDVVQHTDEVTTTDPALDDPVVTRTSETRVVEPAVTGRTDRVYTETRVQPSGGELARRVVVLVFGLIQILIGLRIVLLLLDAREDNGLVTFIYQGSELFVAPFNGIFNSDALRAGQSILDVAAIAAIVGWTLVEVIILWAVNLFRREPTT